MQQSGNQPPHQSNSHPPQQGYASQPPYPPQHVGPPAYGPPPYGPMPYPPKKRGMPVWAILLIIGGVVFFVLPVGCVMLVAVASSGKSRQSHGGNESDVQAPTVKQSSPQPEAKDKQAGKLDRLDFSRIEPWVYAQELVKQRLKAPATAEFPEHYDVEAWYEGENRYRFVGWVDSENSFGANIRTRFEIVVQEQDNGWGLVSFKQLQ